MAITAFLSYSRHDVDFAENVRRRLSESGVEVWLDGDALHAGEDWKKEIDDSISAVDVVILILSPSAIESAYVTYEWAYALGRNRRLIPILRTPTETHPVLENMQYLDFTDHRSRPWGRLVRDVTGVPESDEEETVPDQDEIARDQILDYLDQRGYRMTSFDRVRRRINETYEDSFLEGLIRTYPDYFRPARLKGGKAGLARIDDTIERP